MLYNPSPETAKQGLWAVAIALNLKHLMVFQALMNKGQVSRVAEELGQSQPSVSRSLGHLREHFGDPLFVRTRDGMKPTPHAREIAPSIDAMLDLYYSRLAQKKHFDPRKSRRTIRIAASEIGHALLFPELIKEIVALGGPMRLEAVPLGLHSLLYELETGGADVAFGAFPKLFAGIHERPLFREHYVCLMRPDQLGADESISMRRYEQSNHILVSTSGLGHAHEEIEKALLNICPPEKLRVISHSFFLAALLVERSGYIATLPSRLTRALGGKHDLRVVPAPMKLPTFLTKLYWHERYHQEPSNQWLRRIIAKKFIDG